VSGIYLSRGLFPEDFLRPTVQFILNVQQPTGEIPWFEGGYTDPWDHVEAAMGLSIGGELEAARKAYEWLYARQLKDGSWRASYRGEVVDNPERRESNFVAYIATGIWHHYLVSADLEFLRAMWPMVEKAMGFVLSLQTIHGEIYWAVDADGKPKDDALMTGCSSIYKSLECAHNIAVTLGKLDTQWLRARDRLGDALRNKTQRFDRTWESKSRYSMDWFYPVLCGVLSEAESRARITSRWDEFVEDKLGCRCEKQEPWVTIAESCELVMALLGAGDHARAVEVYSWLHQWRTGDGSYWTGYQLVEDLLWPDEKPTWTAGAILLAADALTEHTAASGLFTGVQLLDVDAASEKRERRILVD
jgi:hypothetical protein